MAGGVNIHAGNSIEWCSAPLMKAHSDVVDGTNYPVQATGQSPNANPVSNAISISALLTLAGFNPAAVNHTAIMRLNGGTWSTLRDSDLVDPGAQFQNGLRPIFWINGVETVYTRPQRTPMDTNANDQIVAQNGAPLDFYIYTGPVLTVTGTASPNPAAVSKPITFTAHVSNQSAADGTLSYTWYFQDGQTATGASVTHSYTVPGTWRPVVTVRGTANNSGGASDPLSVAVGSLPLGGGGHNPGGSAKPRKRVTFGGPVKSRGDTPNAKPGQGNAGGPGPGNRSSGNQAQPTATTLTPGTSPPSTTPNAATPATTAPAAAARTHRPETSKRPRSRYRVRGQQGAGRTVVEGRLIADVIPITPARLAPHPSGPTAHALSAQIGGDSIPPLAGIASGGVVALLLGSGAGLELRSMRRSTPSPRAT